MLVSVLLAIVAIIVAVKIYNENDLGGGLYEAGRSILLYAAIAAAVVGLLGNWAFMWAIAGIVGGIWVLRWLWDACQMHALSRPLPVEVSAPPPPPQRSEWDLDD